MTKKALARAPLLAFLTSASLLMPSLFLAGSDWPRLWGPRGDATITSGADLSRHETLAAREIWRRPAGHGYSSVAVLGSRGFTALSDGTNDVVVGFDAATGKESWRTKIGSSYKGHDGSHDGPIATPTVDGDRLYMVGANGDLLALDTGTGNVAWRHDLKGEYEGQPPFYGFATCPLVEGDLVLVQVGGAKKNNLVAFDKRDGKVVWSVQHASTTGYASPVPATFFGTPQIVVLAADKVFGVKVSDGSLLWSHDFANSGENGRGPVPLPGNRLFVPLANEAIVLQLKKEGDTVKATEAYKTSRIKSSFSPTVVHDGNLFGFNDAYLTCLDAATGELKWRQKTYPGALMLVDGQLVVLGQRSGDLFVAEASGKGYKEKLRVRVFNPGSHCYTGPSFANGRIFVRNIEEIVALQLGGGETKTAETTPSGGAAAKGRS